MLESVSRTAAPVLFVDAALAPALGRALGPAVDLTDLGPPFAANHRTPVPEAVPRDPLRGAD